jgi:hypothetical protein
LDTKVIVHLKCQGFEEEENFNSRKQSYYT